MRLLAGSLVALVALHGLHRAAAVCFNDCSGHGACRGFECVCDPGWDGEDCRHNIAGVERAAPALSFGADNITSLKQLAAWTRRHEVLLVGASSPNCAHCVAVEGEYAAMAPELARLGVHVSRVDVVARPDVARRLGATHLPHTTVFVKSRAFPYDGPPASRDMLAFLRKVVAPPVLTLKSEAEFDAFADVGQRAKLDADFPAHHIAVVGLFAGAQDDEEEEHEEFTELAGRLRGQRELYFAQVTDLRLVNVLRARKAMPPSPSVLLVRPDAEGPEQLTARIPELHGSGGGGGAGAEQSMAHGLHSWVMQASLPLVGELTPLSFGRYEAVRMPMCLLLLDLSGRDGAYLGESNGQSNEALVRALRAPARAFAGRVVFTFVDGVRFEDKARALGVQGGKRALPALAMNTVADANPPEPLESGEPITEATAHHYVHRYLVGALRPRGAPPQAGDSSPRPRPAPVPQPPHVTGVSEAIATVPHVTAVGSENFTALALAEGTDVLLVLHTRDCTACAHFAPYLRRLALRFHELSLPALTVAHMDLTDQPPPVGFDITALPAVYFLPAFEKHPPFPQFTGAAKVLPLIRWVHRLAQVPFKLPDLPQFDETDKRAYKQQVTEREAARRRRDEL